MTIIASPSESIVPQIPTGEAMYDIRGNLVRDDGFDDNAADGFLYQYDPENRLTEVRYDTGTLDENDGLRKGDDPQRIP